MVRFIFHIILLLFVINVVEFHKVDSKLTTEANVHFAGQDNLFTEKSLALPQNTYHLESFEIETELKEQKISELILIKTILNCKLCFINLSDEYICKTTLKENCNPKDTEFYIFELEKILI